MVGTGPGALANHPLAPSRRGGKGITWSIFMHSGEPNDHEICARNATTHQAGAHGHAPLVEDFTRDVF